MELTKEQLLEQVKQLAADENKTNKIKELADIKKKWRRTSDEIESLYDKEMGDEFEKYADQISQQAGQLAQNAAERKAALIEEAKKLIGSKDLKGSTAKMNDIFDNFKAAGRSSSKEADDELWTQFKAAKDEFYEKKKAYFQELQAKFAENKAAKEDLIAKAKDVLEIENIGEASKQMDALMVEWKKLGNAGKECNDDLWAAFNESRKAFYKKKNEHYEHMRELYASRTAAKKELIAKAKRYLAISTFTQEEVNEVKNIRNEWKAIGSAGRENEETLWQEFSSVMNKYFENKKYYG